MTRVEEHLRDRLAHAQQKLAEGDVVGAGEALEAATTACAQAGLCRLTLEDRTVLLRLVHACTVAAGAAERTLREQLGRASSAQAAQRAYVSAPRAPRG